jgi:hypothetical protein
MNNDNQAQAAIIEAFESLALLQAPINSATVPDTAQAILLGKTQCNEVTERIYYQLNTMILNGMLVPTSDQVNTWKLRIVSHED